MEKEIELSVKIKRCHTSMKSLYGKDFNKKISPYVAGLRLVMENEKLNELEAVIHILNSIKDNPMNTIMFMAAAVEVIEKKPVEVL